MEKPRCGLCMFWFVEDKDQKIASCRRYPPTILLEPKQDIKTGGMSLTPRSFFPNMLDFGWCGEWQQRADQ